MKQHSCCGCAIKWGIIYYYTVLLFSLFLAVLLGLLWRVHQLLQLEPKCYYFLLLVFHQALATQYTTAAAYIYFQWSCEHQYDEVGHHNWYPRSTTYWLDDLWIRCPPLQELIAIGVESQLIVNVFCSTLWSRWFKITGKCFHGFFIWSMIFQQNATRNHLSLTEKCFV